MKVIVSLIMLSIANLAYGWECNGRQKGTDTSYDKHIEYATEIYAGRVINSYLIEEIHEIVFELKVSTVFKGNYSGYITLKTTDDGIDPDVAIGHSYIFFLYGSNNINFCGLNIPLGKGSVKSADFEAAEKDGRSDGQLNKDLLRKLLKIKNKKL
ncbi:MAG TPA: hypothetical protein VIZ65_08960 [Cellvibrionaceae bacterium]